MTFVQVHHMWIGSLGRVLGEHQLELSRSSSMISQHWQDWLKWQGYHAQHRSLVRSSPLDEYPYQLGAFVGQQSLLCIQMKYMLVLNQHQLERIHPQITIKQDMGQHIWISYLGIVVGVVPFGVSIDALMIFRHSWGLTQKRRYRDPYRSLGRSSLLGACPYQPRAFVGQQSLSRNRWKYKLG